MANNSVEYITIVSMEGHEFVVDRNCAKLSGTINSMLEGAFLEGAQGRINFQEISTPVLEKVIQYLYYKAKYSMNTQTIPAFTMEPEIAMDLLLAANLYVPRTILFVFIVLTFILLACSLTFIVWIVRFQTYEPSE